MSSHMLCNLRDVALMVLLTKLFIASAFILPHGSSMLRPTTRALPKLQRSTQCSMVAFEYAQNITDGLEPFSITQTAVNHDALARPTHESQNRPLRRFLQRLDTIEDKLDVHKLSSVAYMVSALSILVIGATHQSFEEVPSILELPTWIFFLSSFVQAITSIHMTQKYRATDPVVRNGFMAMAGNEMSMAWAVLYVSPFAPDIFNNFYFGNGIMVASFLPIMFYDIHGVLNLRECIEHRHIRTKEKGGELGAMGDVLSYGLGGTVGFIFLLISIPMLCDPLHDRTWLMDLNTNGLLPSGNHFVPYNYYCNVIGSLAVAFGAFAITLRDRKLCSKKTEQLVMGVPLVLFVVAQLHNYAII